MKCKTISEYLEKSDRTEADVARELGISQAHMNEIKNGKKRPSPELAQKIENLMGIPFRDLLLNKKDTAA
jgi:transcriptional regulator with XRE-family HTH domain